MDLSVIVPTYNRSGSLLKTLECLRRQETPTGLKWEIVVVDNNCKDDTPQVVAELAKTFPVSLRHVVEKKQGASHARNRGVAEARAELLAFTDDDVLTDRQWLRTIYETFMKYSCDGVIGKIGLTWECDRPQWLTDELLGFLAHLDYGPEERPVADDAYPPYGPNMAFARAVFERIGGFDATLGRNGGSLAGGEEPELFRRFLRAGFKAIYQPKAVAHHIVDPRHVRKSFFRTVHYLEGKESGLRHGPVRGKSFLGVPLFVMPQLGRSVAAFLDTAWRLGFQRSLRKEMTVWYFLGLIFGCAQGHWSRRT
jgi:glycosyltransferase involved in cell wall biosynthesis